MTIVVEVATRNIRIFYYYFKMLMSALKDHMTAFKGSRPAQILMARTIVIVQMDTY